MATEIWAHRGASIDAPENTLAAFKRAIELEADGIEIDVQRTSDGKIVICHDEHLGRLTGANGFIKDTTYDELLELNFSEKNHEETEHKILLLEELLDLLKDTDIKLNIELKNSIFLYEGMEEEVIKIVESRDMIEQIVFSTFNHVSAKKLVDLGHADRTAILYSSYMYDDITYANNVGVKIIHPLVSNLRKRKLVKEAHKQGIAVNVWTVNEDAHIAASLASKVDAIITDDVARAKDLRDKYKKNPFKILSMLEGIL